MKNILFLLVISLSFLSMKAQNINANPTTYYLIRHAEKDRTDSLNKNPNLTKKGLQRAEKWASVFKNITFHKIYATNFKRTIQTATPTAKNNNLPIEFYNPLNLYSEDFKKATKGKTVLIVGHSNTTPFFANKIIREKKYPEIDDDNNSNLYIVTVKNSLKSSTLLQID
jgi:broad specificity phosphatase PhoE